MGGRGSSVGGTPTFTKRGQTLTQVVINPNDTLTEKDGIWSYTYYRKTEWDRDGKKSYAMPDSTKGYDILVG